MVLLTFHSYLIEKWRRSWYNRMGVTVNTTALFAQMETVTTGDLLIKCGTTLENRGREGEVYSSVLGENMWTWKWHAHTDPTHPLRPRRSLLQPTTTHYRMYCHIIRVTHESSEQCTLQQTILLFEICLCFVPKSFISIQRHNEILVSHVI